LRGFANIFAGSFIRNVAAFTPDVSHLALPLPDQQVAGSSTGMRCGG
jgi:hypothetical protein